MGRLSMTECTYLPTYLGSPQSCRPKEGACGPTHGHMWGNPPTWDT